MPADAALTEEMVALVDALEAAGVQPVLVGGMALVVLGSQRVTQDFDFVVPRPAPSSRILVEAMYRRKLELVTKLSPQGEVIRTVDNPRIASLKIDSERPQSVSFFARKTGLRVDLLFDFPLPARDIAGHATTVGFPSGHVRIASAPDLLRLKEIAHADRKSASDASDLEFLRTLVKRGR
ncbi:MAG: hypothetical protein AAB152_08940 [Candidatus Coatesbacteria bacterium]